MYRLSNRSPPSWPLALTFSRPFNYYENIQLPGAEAWRHFYTNHSEIATISVMVQSSILVESSFNSKAELGIKIAILLVPSLLWRMHSALYYEKKVVWLVKLVVIMIINDSNSKRGVSKERRWMFCLCAVERHLQVVQWEDVWVRVGDYASVLTSQGQSTPASLWHLLLPAPSGENVLQFWAHTPPSHLKNKKEDTQM